MKTIAIIATLIAVLASAEAVTQQQAEARFKKVGIKWTSSGNCKDKTNPKCTSFEGLRENTVAGAITLKGACDCDITITGGTETGHAGGAKSHGNGTSHPSGVLTYADVVIYRIQAGLQKELGTRWLRKDELHADRRSWGWISAVEE